MAHVYRRCLTNAFNTYSLGLICILFLAVVILSYKLLSRDDCGIGISVHEGFQYKKPAHEETDSVGHHKLAVLVPFRERFEELLIFAPYMKDFLNGQNINHRVFILNQIDNYRFNRASLINAGFLLTKNDFDYIAMHDVDLLPLNHQLKYSYPEQPFHLAAPELHPRYHYAKFIGGILLINRDHFELVKGLSNRYWGWGLEDDEFYVRLKDANLEIRRPSNLATNVTNTFKHLHHKARKRDTVKCYNQREVTRKRDRQTGLHDVKFHEAGRKELTIEGAPLTVINIQLFCDRNTTPWCDCSESGK
ncbi:beta-1,4-galactosyltransferase 7 [Cylas formicarius]|uniref:beta-1,4-galactosyltransferase 7 n=1 Tax=Cylas formicarius TaxID=197179 RepID=UPI002958C2F1|nr:beta-1,4-galactosyltransferase 7 [Cylas formicarius]